MQFDLDRSYCAEILLVTGDFVLICVCCVVVSSVCLVGLFVTMMYALLDLL